MTKKFIFRSNQSVGAAGAELDQHYLDLCFVDTGALDIIRDCEDPRRILVGRTGAGKSALLLKLADVEDQVVRIDPESLSLAYITNSSTLRFFAEAGVRMDIFYRLLWRHVFCVEVLKRRFHIRTEEEKSNFLESLWRLVPRNKQHERALDYLRVWGESFWEDTEYRTKEVTRTLESELEGAIEGKVPGIGSLTASAARRLTDAQKEEIVNNAQDVVNQVQIRELSSVMDLMGDVLLNDPQRVYYITIDKLDEDWVEDRLRLRLIRALIETSLDFARIRQVKIVVAIRNDLLDRVYRYTRSPGFQEEKYRTSSLDVSWDHNQLIEVLDSRIGVLVREQYTKEPVTNEDLLPKTLGKEATIDYMIERTLMRPRDLISFFNQCISFANGKPTIQPKALRDAEGAYSRERLRALADEWYGLYPNLLHISRLLNRKETTLKIGDLPLDDVEENYLELLTSGAGQAGIDLNYMEMVFEGALNLLQYRRNLVLIYYKVGLVGLKLEPHLSASWSHLGGVSISRSEVSEETKLIIHKTFWRALGVKR